MGYREKRWVIERTPSQSPSFDARHRAMIRKPLPESLTGLVQAIPPFDGIFLQRAGVHKRDRAFPKPICTGSELHLNSRPIYQYLPHESQRV